MPKIGQNLQLIEIYNPKSRKQKLPKCDWSFLHTTARNFVRIVDSLHKKDYVIGDIKPQNILVDDAAQVSIVDTDSFQVRDKAKVYRCHVATEGFTPPELLGVNTSKIAQTIYHDRYRIALIIYHLLFTRHPFDQGTWISGDEPSQVDKMKQGTWLYNSQGLLQSHKVTIPLQIIHPKLQELFKFKKCFNDGHNDAIQRPSAEEWSAALKLALDDLISCENLTAHGKINTHKYSATYGKCYWCERRYILKVDIFGPDPLPDEFIEPDPFEPDLFEFNSFELELKPDDTPTPPIQPKPPTAKQTIGGLLVLAGLFCFFATPSGWVAGIILGIIGFSCFSD